jgi:competence protein ComEC
MGKILYRIRPLAAAALGACFSYYGVIPLVGIGNGVFTALTFSGLFAAALLFSLCRIPVVFSAGEAPPRPLRYGMLLAVFLVCGFWTGGIARMTAEHRALFFPGQAKSGITALSGVLLDDPRVTRTGRGMGTLSLRKAAGAVRGVCSPVLTSARGTVPVLFPEGAIPRVKEFGRGSTILADGRFTGDGRVFIASGVFVVAPPSQINRLRTMARIACVEMFSPYRWGGLALALLIGIRDNLDSELAFQYQNAGISYILALSGMHLAIISAVLAFLLKRPLGLKASAVCGSALIIGYIYVAGALPSLERAGLMYVLGAAAIVFGLPKDPRIALCFAFLLQIILDPVSGMSLSFILSYGALAGILLLSGPQVNCVRGLVPEVISGPLAASLAAFIATLAITVGFFGEARPAGILCGLVMGPLSTVFMVAALLFPLVSPLAPLREVMDWAMNLLYTVMEKCVFAAGKAPPVTMPLALSIVLSAALVTGLVILHCGIMKERTRMARAPHTPDKSGGDVLEQ